MWGRVIEIITAVWLALSPFIFRAQDAAGLVWFDCSVATAIAVLAALSYWPALQHAHLITLVVAVGLTLYGRLAELPPPPEQQNHIVIGLFLLMIAVIPSEASQPPRQWREQVRPPEQSH